MFELSLATAGMASVLLALALAVYAIIVGILGATQRDARLQTSARYASVAVFLAMTAAVAVMQTALLTDDFSVKYVAEHSISTSPTWVKVATMWAALEGSILLWAWLLSAYTALLALVAPNTPLRPWALVTMSAVSTFFISVNGIVASPFVRLVNPPLDGPGPNPLLQNHWMMSVHPVLMYLGFVGLTVPFAYAMAALITRRPGSEWMAQSRTWTLIGWGFLGVAKIAGGWWSYEVLGWGGYWNWDPVENVSLLPWLTATAFIHSVQVQERRRMLKAWNLLLIILTFALTILGTFIIRSGVISSVHSFGDGPVGPYFLGFFILVVTVAFGLLALRWDQVRDRADLDSVVSREGSFLLGNVLFLAMTFAVLLGTLFPLIVEAFSGQKVTVGPPFFNRLSFPLWMLIFALMGIGPLLPWRKADEQSLARNLVWLVSAAVLTGGVAYTLGVHKLYPLLTVALAAYNLVSIGLLLSGSVAPRMRLSGRGFFPVLAQYAAESRRRMGSLIVHFAIIVIALGIAGSGGYRVDQQLRIDLGKSAQFQGFELRAVDRFMQQHPGRIQAGAVVEVWREGRHIATLRPSVNAYTNGAQGAQPQLIPTPDVHYGLWSDVYLNIAGTVSPDQDFIVLRAVQSPLVSWIWVGAFILIAGTVASLWPPARQAKARATAKEDVATI